jgi:hypothetical protein
VVEGAVVEEAMVAVEGTAVTSPTVHGSQFSLCPR